MSLAYLWKFLPWGYLFSVAVETPVLMVGLSRRHPWQDRLLAGLWLTACTYPAFMLALPQWISPVEHEELYLAVGETLVVIAECSLFWLAYGSAAERWKLSMWRDLGIVALANMASFGLGEIPLIQNLLRAVGHLEG